MKIFVIHDCVNEENKSSAPSIMIVQMGVRQLVVVAVVVPAVAVSSDFLSCVVASRLMKQKAVSEIYD